MAKKRRYWGLIAPMPGAALAEVAKQCEALGLEGLFAPQLYGSPFTTLAAAAMATSRVKLGSFVALAFTRSPLETACAALELDTISGGRAVLGIGPSVRWWNEDWYGVHYGKPIAHLREAISVIRMIIEKGHTGELGKWEGEYYKLNLDRFKTLAPPVRTRIPLYLPALYETAARVSGEIAEGLVPHPICSEQWLLERVAPSVVKGLAKAGRDRREFDLNICPWVAVAPTKREALDDARPTVAFYALHSQYEKYFAANGFGKEAHAIAEASKAKDDAAMMNTCSDEMVEKFTIAGTPDEVRKRIDRLDGIADSFTLCAPIAGLPPEKIGELNGRIAQTFYL
jgi:probable F420-dependent oxidoreductase